MAIPTLSLPTVPIVGQPLTVLSATILPLVQCHCSTGGSVVLIAQISSVGVKTSPAPCPSCGRMFVLRGLSMDAQGQLQYSIEMSDPPKDS